MTFQTVKIADIISLIALFAAWVSIILLLNHHVNWAVIVQSVAFGLDVLDGYIARKLKASSDKGRLLDSFIDVITYLVFSSVMSCVYLSPNIFVAVITGYIIFSFGILRLVRYTNEGILKDSLRSYYRGVTVVHICLVVVFCYFLQEYIPIWTRWFSSIVVIAFSPAMISNFKSYKSQNPLFFISIILLCIFLSLGVEYGYQNILFR